MPHRPRPPIRLFLAVAGLLAWSAPAWPAGIRAATPRDQAIPSCYEQLREYAPRGPAGDLTVVIDQTAYLDKRLRQIVRETVDALVRPGTNVSVAVFSAYLQGRYLDVLASGLVEAPIEARQRDFVSKRDLRQNDQCLADQLAYARQLVARSLDSAFLGIDPGIVRSDILVAMRDLSRRVGESSSDRRMVLLVSDMLENSSISSFYHDNRLRQIDVESELRRVRAAGIKADFTGARVFVIGAGGVSDRASDDRSYRDPRAMLSLEDFWRRWFADSRAELVEFGKPTPMIRIGWGPGGPATTGSP
jgi:hypothetical protein